MITINGQKMGKSYGNFINLSEFFEGSHKLLTQAYSVVISSLGNVGPGIGKCGPSYSWSGLPDAAKWTEKEIGFQVELEEVKYTANEETNKKQKCT